MNLTEFFRSVWNNPTILTILALLFAPVFGCVLMSLDRKITARMQGRMGPPWLQPFYDLCKLFGKQPLALHRPQIMYAVLHLVFMMLVVVLLVQGQDLLMVLFVQAFSVICLVLGGMSVRSPYSWIGSQRKILQMLDENSDPQFIFDVTMQNHSGYETGLLPSDKQTNYLVDGEYDAEVNEYLALIQESDRALEQFLAELSQLDRKVVVVFFGDHQPFFPDKYNDAWFTGEDEATHAERLWQTDYVIWANYDVAGNSQTSENIDTSINYLGALMKQLIGAPLTDYEKAQQEYADFADSNQNIIRQSAMVEQERLQNEMNLTYQVYTQVAQQLQMAKAKVQEITPVYTVVQPATVPLKAAKPSKMLILIGFVFLAGVGCSCWILFLRDMLKDWKKSSDGIPQQA